MKSIAIYLMLICSLIATGQVGEWTWINGSSSANPTPAFGTMGVASTTNAPPARYEAAEWTDLQGNFWMFGGNGLLGMFNDLWKYNPTTNEWTWMKGSSVIDQLGVYGTQGVPSVNNTPGARGYGTATWVDNSGDLWLFGGNGFGSSGTAGLMNDLWKYNIASNQWTWVKGRSEKNTMGSYGTRLVADTSNLPRSRGETSATWKDSNGNLWLFGGNPENAQFNDLWKYTISTNQWTWMHGDSIAMVGGKYGTRGVSSPTNCPGGRWPFAKWQSQSTSFFLFGGFGRDASAAQGRLNDFWKYDPATNQWTWIAGSKLISEQGTMDSLCENTSDIPSGRMENRAVWKSGCQLIFFGGYNTYGMFNDLWAFNTITGKWRWIAGDAAANTPGVYGTMNVSSPLNKPSARWGSIGWQDQAGDYWMFGGSYGASYYNDIWRFKPDPECLACPDFTAIKENVSTSRLSIYPNPFTNYTTIEFSNPSQEQRNIIIFDIQGKEVFRESYHSASFKLERDQLKEGIYLIQIMSHEGILAQEKIIIE